MHGRVAIQSRGLSLYTKNLFEIKVINKKIVLYYSAKRRVNYGVYREIRSLGTFAKCIIIYTELNSNSFEISH